MSTVPKLQHPLTKSAERAVRRIIKALGRSRQPKAVRAAMVPLFRDIDVVYARMARIREEKSEIAKKMRSMRRRLERLEYLDFEPHHKLERLRAENRKLSADVEHLRTQEASRKNRIADKTEWRAKEKQAFALLGSVHELLHEGLRLGEAPGMPSAHLPDWLEHKERQRRLLPQLQHILGLDCQLCDRTELSLDLPKAR